MLLGGGLCLLMYEIVWRYRYSFLMFEMVELKGTRVRSCED